MIQYKQINMSLKLRSTELCVEYVLARKCRVILTATSFSDIHVEGPTNRCPPNWKVADNHAVTECDPLHGHFYATGETTIYSPDID